MTDRPSKPTRRSLLERRAFGLLLVVACAAPAVGLACSSATRTTTTSNGGNGNGGGPSGGGGEGGDLFGDAGPETGLELLPQNPALKVEVPLQGQTLQFQCIDKESGLPASGATWSLSIPDLGTIDQTGLFTPNGTHTGEVLVRCEQGIRTAESLLKVTIHAGDSKGNVTDADKETLKGPPGATDASWQFLYPYEGTVFPRGVLAPEVHLSSGSNQGTVYYLHIVSPSFEYDGFFEASAAQTQLQMNQQAWDALTYAAGGQTVQVHVSKLVNGVKYGPIFRNWVLAPGNLHGTVYYNTYDSQLAGQTGAIMRIKGNSATPEVLLGNCTVCHSVSSDGSTGAAGEHGGLGGIFDLSGGGINPPAVYNDTTLTSFAALYPDGSVFVVNATPNSGALPGTWGPYASSLRTKNGTVINASGIEGYYALTPVFSHDGKKLAFTDRGANDPSTLLSLLDYDEATQKFSNYKVLAVPPADRHYSWPAFLPDSKTVIFQNGTGTDLMTWSGNTGKLFAADVATGAIWPLHQLNGDGYMPAGARDENLNFEPTTSPIASGGYFWVMFTSRRTWGNRLNGSSDQTKRLWVAAYDINKPAGLDGSHPAFYVQGQELNSGNSRGFWALDPCKGDGESCASGDECCNGFCNPVGDPPVFECGPPDGECSSEFETCETAADCCDPTHLCINDKCTLAPPN